MPENRLIYLGNCIRYARKECNLTQKELAAQTRLSLKTIQDIEKGIKSPTYETLAKLIARLGISADSLFQMETVRNDNELQQFIGKFQACNKKSQRILLKVLIFLAELLLEDQYRTETSE